MLINSFISHVLLVQIAIMIHSVPPTNDDLEKLTWTKSLTCCSCMSIRKGKEKKIDILLKQIIVEILDGKTTRLSNQSSNDIEYLVRIKNEDDKYIIWLEKFRMFFWI